MVREVAVSFDEMDSKLKAREKKDKETKETRENKEIQIIRQPNGLYIAGYDGGGQLPEILKGQWTSKVKLEAMITRYYQEKGRFIS